MSQFIQQFMDVSCTLAAHQALYMTWQQSPPHPWDTSLVAWLGYAQRPTVPLGVRGFLGAPSPPGAIFLNYFLQGPHDKQVYLFILNGFHSIYNITNTNKVKNQELCLILTDVFSLSSLLLPLTKSLLRTYYIKMTKILPSKGVPWPVQRVRQTNKWHCDAVINCYGWKQTRSDVES